MEGYQSSRHRSADGSQGGVPSWLIEENNHHDVVARTPSRNRHAGDGVARSTYPGLCRSPDTRRTFYKSTRQQQRDQRLVQQQHQQAYPHYDYQQPQAQVNPLEPRRKAQHHMIGNMQRMPASEPIYMDIDPSIHQNTQGGSYDRDSDRSSTANAHGFSPSRLKSLSCTPQENPTESRPVASSSPFRSTHEISMNTTPSRSNVTKRTSSVTPHSTTNNQDIPYVSPYVSPVAREYRVSGGMFPTQSATRHGGRSPMGDPSRYDEREIRESNSPSGDGLIMFGDDYDLGSINTGTSQQELLQKRRDVKKRRDGKYGKKKKSKSKERIVNMPPRLLGWDNSPITASITKLTSKDNSQHTPYTDSRSGKKQSQWSILRALTPPEEGSTDASTRESGEEGARRPHEGGMNHFGAGQPQQGASNSDNISLNSFPLLSTNAKEGLVAETERQPEAKVHYVQPGSIPQLQVTLEEQGPMKQAKDQQYSQQPIYSDQTASQPRARQQYVDLYQRQHGEELAQLESHLKYLEQQQQQLEDQVQERQNAGKEETVSEKYEDDRPRSVRFADRIARDIEEKMADSQESPTSIAHFNNYEGDNSNNTSSSVLSPKVLFQGKPKSILRMRKGAAPLDSTGRYPGAMRGRSHIPLFMDGHGREVSPIRSPVRQKAQPAVFNEEMSIPENPDDKDTAVLFDSDADVDLELMRREFDDDSGVVSDAFIEAVAAIVLQTAIRRFLAIRKVQRFRAVAASPGQDEQAEVSQWKAPPVSVAQNAPEEAKLNQQKEVQDSRKIQLSGPSVEQLQEQPINDFYDLAAIQIQSIFRGWWVRDSINVDHYCTTLIQKVFRGFRARMEFEYNCYRIVVVQSVWRRHLARRRTHFMYFLLVRLQAICRGFITRKTLGDLKTLPSSPSRRPEAEGTRRAPYVRSSYEKAKAMKASKRGSPFRPRQPSSVEEARIWHVGAIIIQTYWRSYVGRICYIQSLSDVIIVQSLARKWLTRRWLGLSHGRIERRHHPGGRQPAIHTRQAMSSSNVQFSKFDSFDSINISSMPAEQSLASSNKKLGSMDESVPSVPFRMLPNDYSSEQAANPPTPRDQAREQRMQSQKGHFNDPNRFGRSRNVWKKGTMPERQGATFSNANGTQNGVTGSSDYHKNVAIRSQGGNSPTYAGSSSKWNGPQVSSSPSSRQIPIHTPAKEAPRSKGWNADEEIDKKNVSNLLMAWKQKDKANTFTIRPRTGN